MVNQSTASGTFRPRSVSSRLSCSMANPDKSLLFGPYKAPRVKRGNRAYCLYRNSPVVISSWTDARISWPRCQVLGQQGGSGLLVDDELLRAIKSESVVAIKHWWGVGNKAIWNW